MRNILFAAMLALAMLAIPAPAQFRADITTGHDGAPYRLAIGYTLDLGLVRVDLDAAWIGPDFTVGFDLS